MWKFDSDFVKNMKKDVYNDMGNCGKQAFSLCSS